MFTGLVQAVGQVRGLSRRGPEARIAITAAFEGLEVGESVSVAGACLTVATKRSAWFEADVSAETLACSTLARLGVGARVNLERACRLGDRLGGHLVTGHVDAMGEVAELVPGRAAVRLVVRAPRTIHRFLAPKGSVAVDGVSLTVNRLVSEGTADSGGFEVMLVPHTLAKTTLQDLRPGDRVNLEADILARYVARQLELAGTAAADSEHDERAPSGGAARPDAGGAADRDQVLLDKLREGGFI